MSKVKRALDVVQDLRNLADSIEALTESVSDGSADSAVTLDASMTDIGIPASPNTPTNDIPTTQSTPTTVTPHTTDMQHMPKITVVDLRAFVSERSTPENRPRIKAILSRYGVAKLTELTEDQYEPLMREVAAL